MMKVINIKEEKDPTMSIKLTLIKEEIIQGTNNIIKRITKKGLEIIFM